MVNFFDSEALPSNPVLPHFTGGVALSRLGIKKMFLETKRARCAVFNFETMHITYTHIYLHSICT